ncbi:hypothetical protein [Microbulbifer sp.]|uniref:hypothetical protein n=1 Tax=Microbulbifer sp. TaxID=1908541 RepID=UPI00258DA8E7|nr:hypothetical protein [Microbulbifer sp.]
MTRIEVDERLCALRSKYGELLSLEDIAEVFKYPSIEAVRKAKSRGTLPVKVYRFPNKNGFYARANDVALSINSMLES